MASSLIQQFQNTSKEGTQCRAITSDLSRASQKCEKIRSAKLVYTAFRSRTNTESRIEKRRIKELGTADLTQIKPQWENKLDGQ